MLPILIASLFLVFSFLAGFAFQSLRDFSLSRLETICEYNKNPHRFSLIRKQQEATHFAWEIWQFITNSGFLLAIAWHAIASQFRIANITQETVLQAVLIELLIGISLLFLVRIIVTRISARVMAESILYRFWILISAGRIVLFPVLAMVKKLDRFAHQLVGSKLPETDEGHVITEEIRSGIGEGQREGILKLDAGTMIHRVMEFSEDAVDTIMTPRTDMICIQAETPLEQARIQLLEAGHSRVPIYGKNSDDIIGVLYAKDLLANLSSSSNGSSNGEIKTLIQIIREPLYISESTRNDKLLQTMKRKRIHIAIVLDEYGGVAGLVTMEDILEEIVGDIEDEYDAIEKEPIVEIKAGVLEVDARVHIDDLNEKYDFKFPEDGDYETIGGFVFTQLERVPNVKEQLSWELLKITVLEANQRKIIKLKIES